MPYHFVLASERKFYQHPNSVRCVFNFCNYRLNFLEDFFSVCYWTLKGFVPFPILVLRLQCSSILLRLLRMLSLKKIQIFLPFAYFCCFKAFYYVLSFVSVLIPDASFPEWLSYSGGNQMSIIIWTILILSASIKIFFKTPIFKMMGPSVLGGEQVLRGERLMRGTRGH